MSSSADSSRQDYVNYDNLKNRIIFVSFTVLLGICTGLAVSDDVSGRERRVAVKERELTEQINAYKSNVEHYEFNKNALNSSIANFDKKVEKEVNEKVEEAKKNLKFAKIVDKRPALERLRKLQDELDNLVGTQTATWLQNHMYAQKQVYMSLSGDTYTAFNDDPIKQYIQKSIAHGNTDKIEKFMKAKVVLKEIFKIAVKLR